MNYLLAACFCCGVFSVCGQEVKWGNFQQKPDKNLHISQVIGKTPKGVFTILTDMRIPAILPPVLQRFNAELKLEKHTILRLRTPSGSLNLERGVLLDGRLYLICSKDSQAGGRVRAFFQEIDVETLEPKHEPILIQEINWVEGLFDDALPIKTSPDQRKLMVYNYFPGTPGNLPRNWMLVFNAEMKCEWSVSGITSQIDAAMVFLDYEINNHGEVAVLSSRLIRETQGVRVNPNLKVLRFSSAGQMNGQHDIHLGNFNLQKAELELDTQGRLICAGLFNDAYQETLGAFASIIDAKTGEVKTHAGHFIDSELDALDALPKHLMNFQLKTLHVSPSGRVSLLAEQVFSGMRGNVNYGKVLLLTYPAELSSRSMFNLDKNQTSSDFGYFDSFLFAAKDEQLFLMYNDKGKSGIRKVVFTSTGLDSNSTIEHSKGSKIKIRPRNCGDLPDKTLWIYAETEDKKQYRVGLLKL